MPRSLSGWSSSPTSITRRRRRCDPRRSRRCCRSSQSTSATRRARIVPLAWRARLSTSRGEVAASLLGVDSSEVVFTGDGTEADNLAVTGVHAARGGVAVCSAIEHHAVLHPVQHAGGRIVGVDASGTIDLDALAEALDESVSVVSVMTVNNEVGTIQPIGRVAEVIAERAPGAVLHTDAIQAFAWLDVAEVCAGARARVDQRPQVRRTQGRRRARYPQGSRARAAGARWWPGAWPSQRHPERRRDRRAGDCDDVGERRAQGDGGSRRCAARLLGRRAAGASPTESTETVAARPQGRGQRASPDRRSRGRGAALPSRSSGRVRVGGLFVLEWSDGSVARARRDGHPAWNAPWAPCDCRSGRRRPLRMSTARSRSSLLRSPSCGGSAVQVLVAMSGGVDSSVAAALLLEAGHDVVGVTMKLWGGESDRGCCSVSDVDDARHVAQQLGIDHAVYWWSGIGQHQCHRQGGCYRDCDRLRRQRRNCSRGWKDRWKRKHRHGNRQRASTGGGLVVVAVNDNGGAGGSGPTGGNGGDGADVSLVNAATGLTTGYLNLTRSCHRWNGRRRLCHIRLWWRRHFHDHVEPERTKRPCRRQPPRTAAQPRAGSVGRPLRRLPRPLSSHIHRRLPDS